MNSWLEKYRGIHPGIVLERELKKRTVKQRPFALSLQEHPQTFNAIIKGKRSINIPLALKIERILELEEGTLVLLQAYYDIKKIKEKEALRTPDLTILSKHLFWDTDSKHIDWEQQFYAVIQRVYERGTDADKKEITHFYGNEKVKLALEASEARTPYTVYKSK